MKFASQMAAAVLHPSGHSSSKNADAHDELAMSQMKEEEKRFVADFSDQQHPLPPEEIQEDPRNKHLGQSSRGLGVHDFDLIRTLGTGACLFPVTVSLR